jgi:hypothetical protein
MGKLFFRLSVEGSYRWRGLIGGGVLSVEGSYRWRGIAWYYGTFLFMSHSYARMGLGPCSTLPVQLIQRGLFPAAFIALFK